MIYDVAIIGSGPSGIFAALELIQNSGMSVLLIEKVKRIHDTRNVSNGWFGGSAKSDLKLFVEPGYGGEIDDSALINRMLEQFQIHVKGQLKLAKDKLNIRLVQRLEKLGIDVDQPELVVIPSEKFAKAEKSIQSYISNHVSLQTNCTLNSIRKEGRMFHLTTSKKDFKARKCILALGRGGAHWLTNTADEMNIKYAAEGFDLGVRLEFPHNAMRPVTAKSSSFRLRWDDYRTTAISTRGTVEMENVFDIKTANGRSMGNKQTLYSSVSLLKNFKSDDPLKELERLVKIANVLADEQLIKEPVSRILNDKSVLSPIKEYSQLKVGIEKLFEAFPEMRNKCYLYAPEARLNVLKFDLSNEMESRVKGLYIVGDMSGRTKSFGQAACSGMLAASHIIRK